MAKNRKIFPTPHVEFVSYTGEYPNLCNGVLTVKIDGEEVRFGHDYFDHYTFDEDGNCSDGNYNSFWSSGGGILSDGDYNYSTCQGPWRIDVDELPEKYWDYADELDEVININIRHGCCGGCI